MFLFWVNYFYNYSIFFGTPYVAAPAQEISLMQDIILTDEWKNFEAWVSAL